MLVINMKYYKNCQRPGKNCSKKPYLSQKPATYVKIAHKLKTIK